MQPANNNPDQAVIAAVEAALEQMLMGRSSPTLDLDAAPADRRRVLELINLLSGNIAEMADFARGLATGNLDLDIPGRRNYLAAPLKELHSQLSNFQWTLDGLAKGRVVGRLEYMGEISQSVNTLVERASQGGHPNAEEPVSGWEYHQLLLALNHLPLAVLIVDGQRNILFMNAAAVNLMGRLPKLRSPNAQNIKLLERTLSAQNAEDNAFPYHSELHDKKRNQWYEISSDVLLAQPGKTVYLHTIHDITEWKRNESELRISATQDALTGVHNRKVAYEAIESAVDKRQEQSTCIGFVDIDNLKIINDRFGHSEGDFAIQTIAQTLASSLRQGDTISRVGGDEFILVLPGCSVEVAERIIQRVQQRLATIVEEHGKGYPLSFSHGFSQVDAHSTGTAVDIVALTDVKMYERKRRKKEKGE